MKTAEENKISFVIRKCIFRVYNLLGPGLLEATYVAVLCHEMRKEGLDVKTQVEVPVIVDSVQLEIGYRMDILVNNLVVIEVKAIEALHEVHHMQILTYLKLSGKRLGILVNFTTDDISKSIFRKINPIDSVDIRL
jgi:GxxExxY protein